MVNEIDNNQNIDLDNGEPKKRRRGGPVDPAQDVQVEGPDKKDSDIPIEDPAIKDVGKGVDDVDKKEVGNDIKNPDLQDENDGDIIPVSNDGKDDPALQEALLKEQQEIQEMADKEAENAQRVRREATEGDGKRIKRVLPDVEPGYSENEALARAKRELNPNTRGQNPIPDEEEITSLFRNMKNGYVKWNNYYLGRTTSGPVLSVEEETIEIPYQQGSKGMMTTGYNYKVTLSLIDLNSDIYALLIPGWKKTPIPGQTTGQGLLKGFTMGIDNLYTDHRNLARPMEIIACKDDGVTPSTNIKDRMVLYRTYPVISGDLMSFTRDEATSLEITFNVFEKLMVATSQVDREIWDPQSGKWKLKTEAPGVAIGFVGDPADSGCEPLSYAF